MFVLVAEYPVANGIGAGFKEGIIADPDIIAHAKLPAAITGAKIVDDAGLNGPVLGENVVIDPKKTVADTIWAFSIHVI